jgi:hypothetical protein
MKRVIGTATITLFLVVSMILSVQAGPPGQGPSGDDAPPIELLARTFAPEPGIDPVLQSLALAQTSGRIHVLLQMDHIPTPKEHAALAAQGIELQEYVPQQAWIASVPAAEAGTLASRPGIRWVGLWGATDKLSPRLQTGDFPEWTMHESGRVQAMVLLHADVSLTEGEALVAAHDGIVAGSISTPRALTVWIMPDQLPALAAEGGVLWIEEGTPPLTPTNDGVRAALKVDSLHTSGLTGSDVKLFVFDGGTVDTHNAFTGRLTVIDSAPIHHHSTHVAGTAAGDGASSPPGRDLKGVAPAASIYSAGYEQTDGTTIFWDNAGDIEADYATARNIYGVDLGTNSLGTDPANRGYSCNLEGDYGVSSSMIDSIVRGDNTTVGSAVMMTWSIGNERTGGSPTGRCGSNFATISPPACAKNPIHVGATNSDGDSMTDFSGWGPCDDGRLKPTVSGPGCESGLVSGETFIHSTLSGPLDTEYGAPPFCGTSMSTPAVGGVAILAIQQYRIITGNPSARPLPALMKAWLIHTARDLGVDGPDYIYGYGEVDAQAVIDLVQNTTQYRTDTISASGETDTFTYNVPAGASEFKVSLAWDDPAAAAFAATALVNNLDLEVESPGAMTYYPFSLDPFNPEKAATATAANMLDNQEQVIVKNPIAGTWIIRVRGTSVPQAPQPYALVHIHGDAIACGNELITNGDFEAGSSGWTFNAIPPTASVVTAPAGGSGNALRLGSGTIGDDTQEYAYQQVTIPATAAIATLSFHWYMTTNEGGTTPYDTFQALVYTSTLSAVLHASDLRSNAWKADAWYGNDHIDLSSFAGQTVNIYFRSINNSSNVTSFYVDNVSLQACSPTVYLPIIMKNYP